MPTLIGTKSMPSISVGRSNVKRPSPVLISMPTMPSKSPTSTMASALRIEPLAMTTAPIRPSVIKAQYSGAPNDLPICGQRRGGEADDEGGDDAREQGDERGDRQRRPGAALLRHGVAVERRHHGGGLARHVDEDCRRRAAVLGAVEDARQHDQARDRLQIERQGKHQRDRRDRTDSRQHPDQRAAETADQAYQQVGRRQRDREPQGRGD